MGKKRFLLGWGVGVALALYPLLVGIVFLNTGPPSVGIDGGRLRPCPDKPNCVCSEDETAASFVEPLTVQGSAEEVWTRVKNAVRTIGGTIEEERENYLRATFRTRFLRFTDDMELRLDRENNLIHTRSASRLGHSDLGVNRKRIEELRKRF